MATKKPIKAAKPASKPTKDEISQAVLDGMAIGGLSCFKACQAAGVPNSTFMRWVDADAKLAERYAHAREDLIEKMAQELLDLSDQDVGQTHDNKKDWAAIQKHKLQVDTRKWLLARLAPKKYGDRLAIAGDESAPLKIEQTIDASKLSTEVLAEIIAARDAANPS